MTFSTNLNRLLYVAAGVESSLAAIQPTAKKGYIYVGTDKDGCKYINQNGYGGIVRSDLIDPKSIMWANLTSPKDTEIKLKAFEIDFTQEGVDSTTTANTANAKPVSGEDYILRINFTQMYGMSDEDIYQKYGAVHATATMKKYDFFKAMAYSLIKNFSRLYQPLVQIAIGTALTTLGSTYKVIDRASKDTNGAIHLYDSTGTEITYTSGTDNTKLYILEKSQVDEWQLGTKQYTPVYFKPYATTITNNNDDVVWGSVTDVTTTYNLAVGNGYKYADLEYFCMGERGDQYRNVGWPKSILTKYFVNPENTYYSLDIQYAYKGTCEDIQKSEKTLTILFPSTVSKDTIDGVIKDLGIEDKITYPNDMPTIKFKKSTYTVATSGTVKVTAVKENSDSGTISYEIVTAASTATNTGVNATTGVVTASTTAGIAVVKASLTENGNVVDTDTCTVEVG